MKLTGIQIFWMLMTMDMGMTLMMTMTASLQGAAQDAWMSKIIAGLIAMLIAVIVTKLTRLYPDQTMVQFSRTIMGKWLGGIIVFVYFIQWYSIIPVVLRQFSDMIQIMLLHSTPQVVIVGTMTILVAYVTLIGGIDGIGRTCEILGPIVLLMVLFVLIASLNNVKFGNLMPIYADNGFLKIANGALAPASYLGHGIEYVMLAAFLSVPRKGTPYVYWAVGIAALMVVISSVMVIITIGADLASKMWYPFFEMSKKISLFRFIENMDAFVIVIWLFSVFIKLSIYMFITCYGTAQFFKIKNWKALVWFVSPISIALTYVPGNIVEATATYLLNYWVPVVLPVNMIGLPLLMLIVGKIRQSRKPAY